MFRPKQRRGTIRRCRRSPCSKFTLHDSGLCIHHREQNGARPNPGNQRIANLESESSVNRESSFHEWKSHARSLGERALDRYPGVTASQGRIRLNYVLYDSDKLTWNGENIKLDENETTKRGISEIRRIGFDVLVNVPVGTSRFNYEVGYALTASQAAIYRRYHSLGILNGMGEEYQGPSAILDRFDLSTMARNTKVSCSSADNTSVQVNVSSSVSDFKEMYVISENGWSTNSATGYLQRTHTVVDASRTSCEDPSIRVPMTEREASVRIELCRHVIHIMDMAKRRAVTKNNVIYLPVGWYTN